MLDALGGPAGCRQLAADFYARVARDPLLRPLFPGKTLKCAIEEFSAFLVQFLGGPAEHTQRRWWLSLRESHTRFRIGARERRNEVLDGLRQQDALRAPGDGGIGIRRQHGHQLHALLRGERNAARADRQFLFLARVAGANLRAQFGVNGLLLRGGSGRSAST